MEIVNIADIDKFKEGLDKSIKDTLIKGAYMIQNKAREILTSAIPKATETNKYDDSLADGIYVGKYADGRIKVTAMGNNNSGSGTFRTRFFVGGTKDRYQQGAMRKTNSGLQYVVFKKPMYQGRINPINSITIATQQVDINNLFNNIKEE